MQPFACATQGCATSCCRTIDYACSEISQTGNCYNPNSLQDHCNYVVNSLYHKKSHLGTTCNFKGAAALSQNITNAMLGACVYQSTPSAGGGNTTTTPGGVGQGTTIPGRSLGPPTGTTPSGGQGTTIPSGSLDPMAGTTPIPGRSLGPTAHMIYTGVNDKSASCVTLITLAASSVEAYCVCQSGLSESVLQKTLDYACGNGADCSAILPTGRCYNPNTLQDHCSYAVNSYYQLKSQLGATCDFQGAAALSQSAPFSACGSQATPRTGGSGGLDPGVGVVYAYSGPKNNSATLISSAIMLLVSLFLSLEISRVA
ncbi:hypothetical protein SASPL_142741 [Salvia splendens]|uniref:X8 domain-containing protein n=1 Tax=Salvia splendens TaxID=180675 RepID=A0A8X8WLE6_SALSN|nr:hypothetical protein SASPL_142741 [Salvia splendens]